MSVKDKKYRLNNLFERYFYIQVGDFMKKYKKRNSKKSIVKRIMLITFLIVFSFPFHYFVMTPMGSLRFALFRYGYFDYAQHIEDYDLQDPIYPFVVQNENQTGYSFGIPPHGQLTGNKLKNWLITKYWIFYYADWAGWC